LGRLKKIENIINDTVTSFGHVKVFPRGLPSFIDSLLRGSIRFAKRTGNSVSLINPDNTFDFAQPPTLRTSQFELANPTPWISQDCLLSLGPGKELLEVDDVIDTTIILKTNMSRNYSLQDKILLHSFPLEVSVTVNPGDTFAVVKSHYQLGNGDVFCYLQTDNLLLSLKEIKIEKAVFLGTSTDPFYTQLYRIELAQPMTRKIEAGAKVYFRAYPGYFSNQINVPNAIFTASPMGPFLIDSLSGMLTEGKNFKETLSIKAFNRPGIPIVGNNFSYVTIDKNFPVIDRPLAAHYPMFWQLAEGSMRLTPNRLIMKVDSQRRFSAGIKCVPNLPAKNTQWRVSLTSNDDCTIRFIFYPHPPQEFTLVSGGTSNILVTIPNGEPVTDIEINLTSNATIAQVSMADWSPSRDTVESIQYALIIEATGQATYQSSGLILKPFFLGSEFLTTNWDTGSMFDGGKIWG
jgi:hypothetical protein